MMSDLPDPEEATAELANFASKIGLQGSWVQNVGTETEHYDLFDGAITRALVAGAVQVSARDLVTRIVQPRRKVLASRRAS